MERTKHMKLGNRGITKVAVAAICGGTAVVVAVAVAVILNLGGQKAFRNIRVIDKIGTVNVYRESIEDTLEAYVDMNLESGDEVSVGAASELDLKLDDDKYVYVEENTQLSLKAEGDSANSKTQIYLSEGATLHKLDNKLSDDSSYEIETPNATMAIRGTITWVRVYIGEDGEVHSDFIVYEGKTSLQLHTIDGKNIGDPVEIPEGYQVMTRGGQDFSEIILQKVGDEELSLAPIDYKSLPTQTLKVLQSIMDSGRTIYVGVNLLPDRVPVSFDEIEEILTERENKDDVEGKEEIEEDEKDTSVEENAEADEEDTEPATDKQDKPKKKSTTSKSGTATTPAASTSTASTPASSDNTPASYTVAFTYNGSTFATQTVNSGAAASRPSLQPSASGNWYATGADNTLTAYDFSTPVTGNVTLVWK